MDAAFELGEEPVENFDTGGNSDHHGHKGKEGVNKRACSHGEKNGEAKQ